METLLLERRGGRRFYYWRGWSLGSLPDRPNTPEEQRSEVAFIVGMVAASMASKIYANRYGFHSSRFEYGDSKRWFESLKFVTVEKK